MPRTYVRTLLVSRSCTVALLVCGMAGYLHGRPRVQAVPPPPNVILISLDTLRADHLGCYGYEAPTSPRMDDFASKATLYTMAKATAPWTIPTHGSLFTGKFPFEHGRLARALDTFQAGRQRWEGELDPSPLTTEIRERLRALGYIGDRDANDVQAP